MDRIAREEGSTPENAVYSCIEPQGETQPPPLKMPII